MEIKYRLYPYPVLSYYGNDYVESQFDAVITYKKLGTAFRIRVDYVIENEDIKELISKGEASFCAHLECPQTKVRQVTTGTDFTQEFEISISELNGKVQICPFIIANKTIENFSSKNFAEVFQGFTFEIERGCRIAIAKQIDLYIDKSNEDLTHTPSILSIIKVKDIDRMKVDINRQKIEVHLPEQSFSGYSVFKNSLQHVMYTMIIVPALVVALEKIRATGDESYVYEDYRWYRAIKKTLKDYDIDLDQNGLENHESLEVAQQLLDSPLNKAFSVLRSSGEVEDDE